VFDRRVNAGMRRQPLRAEIAPLLAQRGLLVQSTIAHRNLKFAQATVVTTKEWRDGVEAPSEKARPGTSLAAQSADLHGAFSKRAPSGLPPDAAFPFSAPKPTPAWASLRRE
jgi:hypothetical protein